MEDLKQYIGKKFKDKDGSILIVTNIQNGIVHTALMDGKYIHTEISFNMTLQVFLTDIVQRDRLLPR